MQEGIARIYPRAQIRSAKASLEGADEWYCSGGDLVHKAVGKVNAALDNRIERRKAFDQSGIFVQVADIERPVWQVKFSDEKLLKKNVEILTQYFEGTLKLEAEKKPPTGS